MKIVKEYNYINTLNIYNNLFIWNFKEIILNNEGNKYKIKGFNSNKQKLKKESLIKAIWVFLYTAQKHEIIYQ